MGMKGVGPWPVWWNWPLQITLVSCPGFIPPDPRSSDSLTSQRSLTPSFSLVGLECTLDAGSQVTDLGNLSLAPTTLIPFLCDGTGASGLRHSLLLCSAWLGPLGPWSRPAPWRAWGLAKFLLPRALAGA